MNAELMKYFWLQFSKIRLAVMPCFITLLIYIAYLIGGFIYMVYISQIAMVLLLFIWGTRRAADSICHEVDENTWDGVRLASREPFKLTIGKFIGSTSYIWYGVLWCIPVALITARYWGPIYTGDNLFNLYYLLSLGALCQALSYLFAVALHHQSPYRGKFRVSLSQLLSFTCTYLIYVASLIILKDSTTSWYGFDISSQTIVLVGLVLGVILCLFSAYRIIQFELNINKYPFVFIINLVLCTLYLHGFNNTIFAPNFFHTINNIVHLLTCSFFILIAYCYINAFFSNKGFNIQKTGIMYLKNRKLSKLFRTIPSWVIAYIIAAHLGVVILILAQKTIMTFGNKFFFFTDKYFISFSITAIFLFLTRDLAIIHYLTLRTKSEHGHLASIIWLSFIYSFVPILLSFDKYAYLIVAPWGWFHVKLDITTGLVCLGFILIQVVLLWHMLIRRWLMSSPLHYISEEKE